MTIRHISAHDFFEEYDHLMDECMDGDVFCIEHPLRPNIILMREDKLGVFQKAVERALYEGPQTCASCGKSFDGDSPHVDQYHRETPLCTECYHDPKAARATASTKDDPMSWWNRIEAAE
jgi:hypothetical protein